MSAGNEFTHAREDQVIDNWSKGLVIAGVDGVSGLAHLLRTASDGTLQVDVVSSVAGGGGGVVTAYITKATGASAAGDSIGNPTLQGLLSFLHGFRKTAGADVWGRITAEYASAAGVGEDDEHGAHVSPIPKTHTASFAGVEDVYDNTTVSATSSAVKVRRFNECLLQVDFAPVTGTPTDIQVFVQFSNASAAAGPWYDYPMGPFGALVHDDTIIGAAGLQRAWDFRSPAEWVRLKVDTNGTGASDKFGIDNALMTMKTS